VRISCAVCPVWLAEWSGQLDIVDAMTFLLHADTKDVVSDVDNFELIYHER